MEEAKYKTLLHNSFYMEVKVRDGCPISGWGSPKVGGMDNCRGISPRVLAPSTCLLFSVQLPLPQGRYPPHVSSFLIGGKGFLYVSSSVFVEAALGTGDYTLFTSDVSLETPDTAIYKSLLTSPQGCQVATDPS